VRAPVFDRVPGAVVEAPPRHELDRRGEEEEGEVQGFLGPGEPPAHALPEADDEERDPDPEAEEGEPSEPSDLPLRCGEGLQAGVGAEVVPPPADEGRQVGALVDVHAAHRIRRHGPLGMRRPSSIGRWAISLPLDKLPGSAKDLWARLGSRRSMLRREGYFRQRSCRPFAIPVPCHRIPWSRPCRPPGERWRPLCGVCPPPSWSSRY